MNLKSCFLASLALILMMCVSTNAQNISQYVFTATSGSFVELSGTNPLMGGNVDDGYFNNLPLGFTYYFMGVGYTTLSASTDGHMTLGQSYSNTLTHQNNLDNYPEYLPSPPRPIIAPLWDDLNIGSSLNFTYSTAGSPGNRVFIAQWLNVRWNFEAADPAISFQVKLFEADGSIEFIYRQEPGIPNLPSASIGLSGGAGASFPGIVPFLSIDGTGPAPSVSPYSEADYLDTKPATGQIYRFAPAYFGMPAAPVSIAFSSVGPTAMTVDWIDNATSETYFHLERATDALFMENYISSIVPSMDPPGTGAPYAIPLSGLSSGTTYYFRITARNEAGPPSPGLEGNQATNPGSYSGSYTVGGSGTPDFATLTDAFAALSAGGLSGPVILALQSGYTGAAETYPLLPPQGGSPVNTVTIYPGVAGLSISNSGPSATIEFIGTRSIIVDGRVGGTGSTPDLLIENTSTGASTLSFWNDASANIVRYCSIRGSSTTYGVGVVTFGGSAGGAGNDDNTLEWCGIGGGPGTPIHGIYSAGGGGGDNSGNIVSHNDIFDFFNGMSNHAGIELAVGNAEWTIDGNSFYQTVERNVTGTNVLMAGIRILSGGGHSVVNNYIGGRASQCAGAALTVSGGVYFHGVKLSVGNSSLTSVQNNVFRNINIATSATTYASGGIWVDNGWVACGDLAGNIIGSQTVPGDIVFNSSTGVGFRGLTIVSSAPNPIRVENNLVGGITIEGTGTPVTRGILVSGYPASFEITGNVVGSLTTENSISSSTNSAVIGISVGSGNTLVVVPASVHSNAVGNITSTSAGANAYVYGVYVTGVYDGIEFHGSVSVEGNIISSLQSATVGGSVFGILHQNNFEPGQGVLGNHIHSLSSTAGTGASSVFGIWALGPAGATKNIDRNIVHSLTAGSSSAVLYGIHGAGGHLTVQNNRIRLGIDGGGLSQTEPMTIMGIHGLLGPALIRNNSIYIGGTGVASGSAMTAGYYRIAGTNDTLVNNIIVNARSNAGSGGGHHAAVWNNPTSTVSDYNLYLAGGNGGMLASVDNGATGIPDLRALRNMLPGRDGNSGVGDPNFVAPEGDASTLDLHLQGPTPAEGNGDPASEPAGDCDDETRATLTPSDIGADAGMYSGVDIFTPTIVHTSLGDTDDPGPRTLTALIDDPGSGMSLTGSERPRVWFRRATPVATAWGSSPGVLVSGDGFHGEWTFTIDYSLLGIVPALGDIYEYYLVAQDAAPIPNIWYHPFIGASHVNVTTQLFPPSSPHSYLYADGPGTLTWIGGTGNWSDPGMWSPAGVPDPSDTAVFVVTSPVSVCMIDQDAVVGKIRMEGSGAVSGSGPVLRFPASGSRALTVLDSLVVIGLPGAAAVGGGDRGGLPQLTSNGNAGALLRIYGSILTNLYTFESYGWSGINMNEGVVEMVGGDSASIASKASASGFKLGDLRIGDGVTPKTVTFTSDLNTRYLAVRSLTVRSGSTLSVGDPGNVYSGRIGLFPSGSYVNGLLLTGGVTVEQGATFAVNPASGSTIVHPSVNLYGGGIRNDGTMILTSGGTFPRWLSVNIQGGSNTVSGSNPIAFNGLNIISDSGLVLEQDASVTRFLSFTNGNIVTGPRVISIGPGATTQGAWEGSFVAGNLKKHVPAGSGTPTTFDVGNLFYSPVVVTPGIVSVDGYMTASAMATDHPDVGGSGIIPSRSVNRHYSLTNEGVVVDSFSVLFNFTWQDLDPGVDPAKFTVRKRGGGLWTSPATRNPLSGSIEATGLTSFSDFAIGEAYPVGISTWVGGAGRWSDPLKWWPPSVPGQTDTALFLVTAPVSVCTLDQNAEVGKLLMLGSGIEYRSGPILTFPASGALSLTVRDSLCVIGLPGAGERDGSRGGMPQLTANGNDSAFLRLQGEVLTNITCVPWTEWPGIHIDQGVVELSGSTPARIAANSLTFRLADLRIGDGVVPKSVTITSTDTDPELTMQSLTVKAGSSLQLGDPSNNRSIRIGNNRFYNLPLTGGVRVEQGATLGVTPAAADPGDVSFVTIEGGGLLNDGAIVTHSGGDHPRKLRFNFYENDTLEVSGSSSTTFSIVHLDGGCTLSLQQDVMVTETFMMNVGRILTGPNTLTIAEGATHQGGTYCYIEGNLRLHIPAGVGTPVTFPLGDLYYLPLTFTPGTVTSPGYLRASMTRSDHPAVSLSGIHPQQSVNRYYSLVAEGLAVDSYAVAFMFPGEDIDPDADFSKFVVRKFDEGTWSAPASINPQPNGIEATGMNSFSDYVFGEPAFNITASAGPNGVISNSGPRFVDPGSTISYSITPNYGYHVDSLIVDGVKVVSSTSYSFVNVQAHHTIRAVFAINTYPVSASAGPNGTVAPAGATFVQHGGTITYSITASSGFHVDSVFVDGIKTDSTSSYTFTNVQGSHTIRAVFAINIYTITVMMTGNGIVTPPGPALMAHGTDLTFFFTPDFGCSVDSVFVDGMLVDSMVTYTVRSCSSDHTIRVVFANDNMTVECSVNQRWNIVSLPLNLSNSAMNILFPAAQSGAYAWSAGYVESDTLRNGRGYWVKLPESGVATFTGTRRMYDEIPVSPGWNMIGSLTLPVPISNVVSVPPGLETSPFYRYSEGYHSVDTLQPGVGYWVKVSEPGGTLILSVSTPPGGGLGISRRADQELPPPPPGSSVSEEIPISFGLDQNYPNPFNPATTISFRLPVRSMVNIEVTDVLGREVVRLAEGIMDAGYRELTWKADGAATGIYYYRMVATPLDGVGEIYNETRRMLLVR